MDSRQERQRLRDIVHVFSRHGFKRGLGSPAKLRMAFEELGPTFVKIGQILSTRPDLLPAPFVEELANLQDDVNPMEFDVVAYVTENSLSMPLGDIFLEFDPVPLASASIAQVHRAVLAGGVSVAVKVQRPGIRETMETDIALLRRAVRLMKLGNPMAWIGASKKPTVIDPEKILDELWRTTQEELDFLNESVNIKRFKENNSDVDYVMVPRVFEKYTTPQVIVMEYISGVKLSDTAGLKMSGYELDSIGRKLTSHFVKQVLRDGFFHADPHPGNIIIHEGKIAYIDFGMMGSLQGASRRFFNMLIVGVAKADIDAISRAVMGIGARGGSIDYERLRADVEKMYANYVEISASELDLSRLIHEVFAICRANEISMPREMTMLLRALVTLEGVVARISPGISVMEVAAPYAREYLKSRENMVSELRRQIHDIYRSLQAAPEVLPKIVELLDSAVSGRLRVGLYGRSLDRIIVELHRMVNKIVMGIMLSSLIVASSLVVNARAGPLVAGVPVLGLVGYVGAGVASLWVLVSILRSGKM
ncbi:MAG: ABC1 kinase family protein [Bacillota bacterium]